MRKIIFIFERRSVRVALQWKFNDVFRFLSDSDSDLESIITLCFFHRSYVRSFVHEIIQIVLNLIGFFVLFICTAHETIHSAAYDSWKQSAIEVA